MNSREIRQSFVDYFRSHAHRAVPSSPLVPQGDPTLLFTNAGMVQFKDRFLGLEETPDRRAVSVQKCLRVSGKHNDLENVGPSPRHHTFFEMLGNFSFGDYFKEDAIRFAWELVTEVWGLPPDVLSATVFEEDDEAEALWRRLSTLPAERIRRCSAKDNFWAMGEIGPCGPCSEIFVDRHPHLPAVSWEEGTDCGRYLEIWNLVFMQFQREADGSLRPLPNPSIDTGAGLERVSAVLQGVDSNYDSDLFRPILAAAADLASRRYGADLEADVSLRVIADHLRAVSFLLADGVVPGNEGRGYVLRRILRRAVRHGMRLGFEEAFLHRLVSVLRSVMGEAYPELGGTETATIASIQAEEEKFLATVAVGARQVQEAIEEARRAGSPVITGPVVFRLYDTHGLPLEMIREIAEEERFAVDEEGFAEALDEQRRRSRSATGESKRRLANLKALAQELGGLEPAEFVGYESLRLAESRVEEVVADGTAGLRRCDRLPAGASGIVLLDRTVFYAESGGQVGDRGEIHWSGGRAQVGDVQKDGLGHFYHFVEVVEGELARGSTVSLEVGERMRRDTERNHTATHLLHAALRETLGTGVRQAGSLVAPDRLRFDFTCSRPMTADEVRVVEDRVNAEVRRATPLIIQQRSYREAVADGAMALFGEKYGDTVRTVRIDHVSLELCGGCHVRNTGEIGLFVLAGERGVASGVRRVEALTGRAAGEWMEDQRAAIAALEDELGVAIAQAVGEVQSLKQRLKVGEREAAELRRQLVAGENGASAAEEVGGVLVLAREVPPAPPQELRELADTLRDRLGSGVVVLGARGDGRVSLVATVSRDLTDRLHAGRLVQELARQVDGGGGGRADFAQAGGKRPEQLEKALAAAPRSVASQLAGGGAA